MSFPIELRRIEGNRLLIVWDDGFEQGLSARYLRDHCPCAACRDAKEKGDFSNPLRVLSPEETKPLSVATMHPVGNYAYNIHFSDGHATGIFTFEFLRQLSE